MAVGEVPTPQRAAAVTVAAAATGTTVVSGPGPSCYGGRGCGRVGGRGSARVMAAGVPAGVVVAAGRPPAVSVMADRDTVGQGCRRPRPVPRRAGPPRRRDPVCRWWSGAVHPAAGSSRAVRAGAKRRPAAGLSPRWAAAVCDGDGESVDTSAAATARLAESPSQPPATARVPTRPTWRAAFARELSVVCSFRTAL